MTDLREVNYRNLKRQFLDCAEAKRAARRIDSATTAAKSRALAHLLRHHDETEIEITDEETWYRDEVDELLHFYSIMEIALLLDLVPRQLPEELQAMASRHLRHPAVNRYFVSNYPLVLPQIFLLRLGGYVQVRFANDSEMTHEWAFPVFLQLLHLDSLIHGGDEDVDTLLWFLDGGSTDGYDVDDTLDALKTAKTFFRHVNRMPEQMTACDSSLVGLASFLDFCQELDAFLRTRDLPDLLRYEAWHLYGYWFGNLGIMMGKQLDAVIERVANWKVQQQAGSRQDKKDAVSRLRGAIERLVSGEYGMLPLQPQTLPGVTLAELERLSDEARIDIATAKSLADLFRARKNPGARP